MPCLRSAFLGLLLLGAPVLAQANCGGLNQASSASNSFNLASGTWVAVLYTPPTTINVNQLRFYFPAQSSSGGISIITAASGACEIRPADPVTNEPSPTVLASGTFGAGAGTIAIGAGWRGPTFNPPVVLSAGQAYYLMYRRTTGNANIGVQNNPPGPDVTPYRTSPNGTTWSSLMTVNQWKVRLRNSTGTCQPPGPPAAVSQIGPGCAGSGSVAPTLSPVGLPTLGSNAFAYDLDATAAAAGAPYGLFWSLGHSASGLPIGPGCTLYLEPVSLLALMAQGFNPLISGTLDGNGQTSFTLPVPNDPMLGGVQFAFQAAILVPFGVPSSAPGVNYVLTDAQLASLGL